VSGLAAPPLGKDLLGLEPLTSEQITLILDTAEPFKEISERAIKKVPTLRGATIVLDSSGGSVNDSITLGRRFRVLARDGPHQLNRLAILHVNGDVGAGQGRVLLDSGLNRVLDVAIARRGRRCVALGQFLVALASLVALVLVSVG